MVLDKIQPHLRSSTIPAVLQLAATLRFVAEGPYQRSVGNDANISMARSTISEVLTRVIKTLEHSICHQWIQLAMGASEKQHSKDYFYNKYRIPGIIVCIDGTHIKVLKPSTDEHLYFNRKGFFSMNAMIVCDSNMTIRAVDVRYPGSSHDAFVWSISTVRQHFLREYEIGERTSRLLGDSGYGIEPFLLTPYRDPEYGSLQNTFNRAHSSARNVIERTIGLLKSRFRCLQGALQYNPQKVVKIVNVCCALHNICRCYNIECPNIETITVSTEVYDENSEILSHGRTQNEGQRIRNEIANAP
ncbi:putative nuclease HARBI1 [Bactrocera neohumeralis]|uniref:putative nuclease HARBI1 n=1 Tax=Bactrocera neohumeralis TaxID=98809 RepID=UPI002165DECB|nr:putative nuclease HARBI1 [Bactrocera neohumeralis]